MRNIAGYLHCRATNHGGLNEDGSGGSAILFKKGRIENITEIASYAQRCMEINLQTHMGKRTLYIINTYAPHMCYGRNGRAEYWEEIKYIPDQIPKKGLVIWTADNNGQIDRPTNNNDRVEEISTNAHIGQWAMPRKVKKKRRKIGQYQTQI